MVAVALFLIPQVSNSHEKPKEYRVRKLVGYRFGDCFSGSYNYLLPRAEWQLQFHVPLTIPKESARKQTKR